MRNPNTNAQKGTPNDTMKTTTKPAAKSAPEKKSTKSAPAPEKKGKTAPAPAAKEKPGKKSKGKENPYSPGDFVVFDGYAKEQEEPIFAEGDFLRVLEITGTNKFTAERITLEEGEDEGAADTVFLEECHNPTDEEQEEIDTIVAQSEEADEEEESDESGDDEEEDADEESDEEDDEEDDAEEESEDDDSDDDDDEEEAKPAKKGKGKPPAPKAGKEGTKPAKATKDDAKPAKAKKKAKDEEEGDDDEEEAEDPVVLTESVEAIIAENDGDALEAVKAIKGRMEGDVMDYGILLCHIHEKNIHATIMEGKGKKATPKYEPTKKGFAAYVKDVLDLEPRVAYGYMDVARTCSALGVDSATVARIGWTKLQHITDIATKDNIKTLLKKAEGPREALIAYVREEYTDKGEGSNRRKGSGDSTKKLTLKVAVHGDQAEMVKTAMATAKEEIGSEDDGLALVHIIQEWAAMKDGSEDDSGDESEDEGEEEDEAPAKPAKKKKAK